MLNAAIIGLGIGQQLAEFFDGHPRCEVATLCDLAPDKLEWAARRFPGRKLTARADDAFEDPAIDVVAIASYDDVHHAHATAALRAGKHVFVEKPICVHRGEAEEVRALLRERPQLVLSSNLVLRLSSRFQELKRRIDAGAFGTLFCFEGDYQYGRLEKITEGWRGRMPAYSVALGGGVHLVDLLLWLSGDDVSEVMAFGTNIATRGSRFSSNDTVLCILKMRSGMIAKIGANFGCVQPHFHDVRVYGTRATFLNRPEHAVYHTSSDPAQAPERSDAPYRDYRKPDLVWSFLDAIHGGAPPLVSCDEVFRAAAVCFAIEESLQKGVPVPVTAIE
jgi:predicted dehydrogenase